MITINSYYDGHKSAIPYLRSMGINLQFIPHNSPFFLAMQGKPAAVIHPNAHKVGLEFPHIKFFGSNCKFPHYDYDYQDGFSYFSETEIKQSINDGNEAVWINTHHPMLIRRIQNDTILAESYAQKSGLRLSIYGVRTNSLYYRSPTVEDTYAYYKNASVVLVDSLTESLKALSIGKNVIGLAPFPHTLNIDGTYNKHEKDKLSYLQENSWNNLLKGVIEELI